MYVHACVPSSLIELQTKLQKTLFLQQLIAHRKVSTSNYTAKVTLLKCVSRANGSILYTVKK